MGPEKTIDGSGLDGDLHGTTSTDMWLSNTSVNQPVWIQYEFDNVYKLHEMWVWNSNSVFEAGIGFGIQAVTVEYSVDGNDWTPLETVSEFTRAPGTSNYAHNTTVDFQDTLARYVRITAGSNWGGVVAQFGLSEVRFYYLPLGARNPQPASGAFVEDPAVELYWRPGREAVSHEVYVSDDRAAVNNGDAAALLETLSDNRYDLSSAGLDYNTIYFWKVVEVNDAGSPIRYEGPVWNFSTPEFFVLDDFEGYTDDRPDRIFETWRDKYPYTDAQGTEVDQGNGTGMTVGDEEAPYGPERTIVHSGRQSMPLRYDNTVNPFYSETQTTDYALPKDWTVGGVDTLVLDVQGRSVPFAEPSPGSLIMNGVGADIYNLTDEFRFVYKELNGDGSIIVRLDSVDDIQEYTKAGIMIRSGLDPLDEEVLVAGNPRDRVVEL